jgi:hypothetical protein
MIEDEAVREVMNDAIRMCLNQLVSASDGTQVCVISPKR